MARVVNLEPINYEFCILLRQFRDSNQISERFFILKGTVKQNDSTKHVHQNHFYKKLDFFTRRKRKEEKSIYVFNFVLRSAGGNKKF